MSMRAPRRVATIAMALVCALGLCACQSTAAASSVPSPSEATTPAPTCPDFTRLDAATTMVHRLMADAGSSEAIMVQVQPREVDVSVLVDETPVTWACRDGVVAKVPSDIAYVDQASFDPDSFDFSDIGALFRAAAAVAGSADRQRLQIVDYSGGRVMMSVSTDPESRTVFFNADGSLLEDLDFTTYGGVQRGLRAVEGQLVLGTHVSVTSNEGVWMDYAGTEPGTVTRRERTATVPVTTVNRTARDPVTPFAPSLVKANVIWAVVEQTAETMTATPTWSVVIDDRAGHGLPRMYLTIGSTSVVTDLNGRPISPS
jgi:hypothetical protein